MSRTPLWIIVWMLALKIVCACSSGKATEKEIPSLALDSNPTIVRSVSAVKKDFSFHITGNGKIKPMSEVKLFSDISGPIEYCKAKDGMIVRKNETLIRYPDNALKLKLERARIKLSAAELEFKSQLIGYSRSTTVSDSILKRLRAMSGLSSAEIDIAEANLEIDKTVVKSPIEGTLSDVKVQVGQWTKNGDELFTVYSQDRVLLEIDVLESDIGYVKKGQKAVVTSLASPRNMEGVVEDFNPRSDDNGLVKVRLRIMDNGGILPGMNAHASIYVPYRKCVVLPKEAVVMRDGKPVVFTIEGGLSKWNFVSIGKENENEIEVIDGIKEGQKVIITNNLQLGHDAPIIEDRGALK